METKIKYIDDNDKDIVEAEKILEVSERWANRKKSNLVEALRKEAGLDKKDVVGYLGVTKPYLENKLHRDSFSFEDIIIVAYACGFVLSMDNENYKISLALEDILPDEDCNRIKSIEKKVGKELENMVLASAT